MTLAQSHPSVVKGNDSATPEWTTEYAAMARVTSLKALGVVATARPWSRWLAEGDASAGSEAPWLVVTPDDLTLEIVFSPDASLLAARRVLMRLLADRWNIRVLVEPSLVPFAIQVLGDLPLTVRRWDRS